MQILVQLQMLLLHWPLPTKTQFLLPLKKTFSLKPKPMGLEGAKILKSHELAWHANIKQNIYTELEFSLLKVNIMFQFPIVP